MATDTDSVMAIESQTIKGAARFEEESGGILSLASPCLAICDVAAPTKRCCHDIQVGHDTDVPVEGRAITAADPVLYR